jgi:ketosteroid isomerase-like protein
MGDEGRIRELELRLGRLEDERAILQTLYAYAHSIDYGDEALFADCWTADAVLEWPWRDPLEGREAILGAFRAHTHAPDVYHKHFMVEPRIELRGDEAIVQCLYSRLDRDEAGEPYVRSFGRYVDRLVRCPDGRWRFARRRAENEAVVRRTVPR